ncbi:hypothetical protein [Pleionea sp. CnH1-48]|uniref:hypothetical protein n=1 Tax=Pleionea sp. CnH1-48 TaxID=2954494 RepID=UPI002097FD95|nr:hypothetical protein [Pleionea sp. CnH1-48]MCO7224814.1 hypothetical protein [Pleionea sp. CnH1-48]
MNNEIEAIDSAMLYPIAESVFKQLFDVVVMPEGSAELNADDRLIAVIDASGSVDMWAFLAGANSVMAELAAPVYGKPAESVSETEFQDIFKEALNLMSGELFKKLNEPYKPGIPYIEAAPKTINDEPLAVTCFYINERCFSFSVYIKNSDG